MTTLEFKAECKRRREAGLKLDIPYLAFKVRTRAKELGAIWDGYAKLWLMPDKATMTDIENRIAAWQGKDAPETEAEEADAAQDERAEAENDAKEPTLDEALRELARVAGKLEGVTRELAEARKANAKLQNDLTQATHEARNLQNVVDFQANTIKTLEAQLEGAREAFLNSKPVIQPLSDADIKSLAEGAARATLEAVLSKLTNARTAKRTQAAPLAPTLPPAPGAPAPVRALDLDTHEEPARAPLGFAAPVPALKPSDVRSIVLDRAEGPAKDCIKVTVSSFEEAHATIRKWASTAPASGGYDKTDFVVTFGDGETYSGRFDMKRSDTSASEPLKDHMLGVLTYRAGYSKPAHLTLPEYTRHVQSEPKAMTEARDFLRVYFPSYQAPATPLVSLEAPKAPAPAPKAPAPKAPAPAPVTGPILVPAPKKARTWAKAGAIFKKPGGRP